MLAIQRKMFRDLLRMKGQAFAIAAVIGCGVAVFVGARNTLEALSSARDAYYERYRFAEVFSSLKRAPAGFADRLAELPGVAALETRVVQGVTLDLPDLDEPAIGKIVSLPDLGEPRLNHVHLLRGRLPEPGRGVEILVEEAFAKANGIGPGDPVRAVLNGRLQTLSVTGVALSPEYVTTIQPGSLFPDDRRFGIFWMRRRALESAFDMEGAFNDVSLVLMRGAEEEEVIRRLDLLLAAYGGLGAYGRERHLSHRFVSDELNQLRVMSLVPPAIFLGVAAFLLNVALRRLLSMQREQIAALKAFGYGNREVAWHYLQLVGLIAGAGVLLGWLFGTWMGRGMTALYDDFYRFPGVGFHPDWRVYLGGAALSLAAAFAGVAAGLRRAVAIPPAEAMRPEPPPDYRPSLVERLGWHRWLGQSGRMVLRELSRRPMKAALTTLGIAFACAILVVGNFGKDAIDYLMDFQFELQERQDATVVFHEAVPESVLGSLGAVPGVLRAEPFRSVPVRLRKGPRHRQTSLVGLGAERDLHRLVDSRERVVELPPGGLVLSSRLADILALAPGELVEIEVLEGRRLRLSAPLAATVEDFAGMSAWMRREDLHRLLREQPVVSGAYLELDPLREAAAYRELKEAPAVAAVSLQRVAMESFLESFGENLMQMRLFNIFFASVIAVGVVYNSARVSLSERSRELATLRVVGFTRGEVSRILLGELSFLTALAIPLGFLIGAGLCRLIAAALETELYRIPFVLSPGTYGLAGFVIVAATAGSAALVRRGIDRLDLIATLKAAE